MACDFDNSYKGKAEIDFWGDKDIRSYLSLARSSSDSKGPNLYDWQEAFSILDKVKCNC